MASTGSPERMFPALLKYWRGRRGLSQLDLGLTAEVSARHISFLETGRSGPSKEMVLLLAEVLDVPLRDRNDLLRAAGFDDVYPEPDLDELLTGPLAAAIDTMMRHHEPYPMLVLDRRYDIVRSNEAGLGLAAMLLPDDPLDTAPDTDTEADAGTDLGDAVERPPLPNLLRVLFDPVRGRELVVNWDEVAATIVRRLQRELLTAPHDEGMQDLIEELRRHPDLDEDLLQPDLGQLSEPMVPVRLNIPGGRQVGFLTTVTAFNAPQNVTLDELRIEAFYPADDETAAICQELFGR